MKTWYSIIGALVLAVALGVGCSDDSTRPEETGTVSGTVTFRGTWPAIGNIQISIWSQLDTIPVPGVPYPILIPFGAPAGTTEPVDSGSTAYDFSFEGLDDGEYLAVYVSWRDPANPAGARFLGMYWPQPDSVGVVEIPAGPGVTTTIPVTIPTPITIEAGNRTVSGLRIAADLDLAQ